mmetsp:Transcript_23753/g.50100  ORF Transcript_23753/g.50100 Transcript_23753/m.50100 type:complete len:134 (+) Transcript_23753:969-1370(+)
MEYAQGDGFGPEGDDVVDCGDSFISLEDMTVAPFGKEPVEKSLHSLSSPLRSSIFPKYLSFEPLTSSKISSSGLSCVENNRPPRPTVSPDMLVLKKWTNRSFHVTLIGSSARVPVNFTLQSSAGPVERCDVLW